MADEDTVLEEAMDNLKEAGQRIRATQSLMRSQGMTDGENYRDLLTRLSTALAMTEAAYLEARRRRDLWLAGGWALPKGIAVTQMSRLRLGADCEGVLIFVTEDALILTSATAAPTVFRCFWLHRVSGEFRPCTLGLTGTLGVAVTLMGS